MKENRFKNYSMRTDFILSILIPGLLLLLNAIISFILVAIYVNSTNRGFLIAAIIVFSIMTVLISVLSFFIIKRMIAIYYLGLYKTTTYNLAKLSQGNVDIKPFPTTEVSEFKDLNDNMDSFKSILDNTLLEPTSIDYNKIALEYVDRNNKVVTLDSFRRNLDSIIIVSQSFRNALLEFYYDTERISQEDKKYLLKAVMGAFEHYSNVLFIDDEKNPSIYVYLPDIDSFSRIKEQIIKIALSCTITERSTAGITSLPMHASLVCYPFSHSDEMFSDLRYAKRQGQLVNFYLPNRLKSLDSGLMVSTSMNLNYMTKIIRSVDELDFNYIHRSHDMKVLTSALKNISSYLHIDHSGIIMFDQDVNKYRVFLSMDDSEKKLFKEGEEITHDFIESLNTCVDEDNTYYFSNRQNVNNSLAAFVDRLGISSGYYQIIKYDNKIIAIVYYLNDKSNLRISTYIREAIYFFSQRIATLFISGEKDKVVDEYMTKYNSLAALSEYSSYSVTDEMNISDFSPDLKIIFPKIKVGEPCYRVLHGLDKPCADCPMKTFKKQLLKVKNMDYEVSLTLNSKKNHNRTLLVRHISNGIYDTNLFDRNYLTFSYYALLNYMKNLYLINARGYILLLHIDNIHTFVTTQGSEGASFVVRSFVKNLRDHLNVDHVFSYNEQTIAIVFPEYGHVDIVKACEKIYGITKQHYFDDGSDDQIIATYLPIGFPHGFATAEDFLKNVLHYYNIESYERNKDYVYFLESGYARSVSHHIFMVEVLDKTFIEKNYSFFYQPYVNCSDKRIYGAELLLRIPDSFQGTMLRADELSDVAAKEHKVDLITGALLSTIRELSQQYSQNVFKINDLKRLSINTDVPFLENDNFIDEIISIQKEYKYPSGFIGLEIGEKEIMDNIELVSKASKHALQRNIPLICDRYTGQFVSLDKLKDLGFTEIKIDRKLVFNIDKDARRLNELKSLMLTAKQYGIKATVVGVENSDQFTLIREIDENCFMQGYHFYKPLDKNGFVSSLQISNK